MIVSVSNKAKWLLMQLGQLVLMVGLTSLVFNYAYRFLVDRTINTPLFYAVTLLLALVVIVAVRRDYLFVSRYEFTPEAIVVRTALGAAKRFETQDFKFVPSLHKTISLPEPTASLSFDVQNRKTGRRARNYAWTGFPVEDFRAVCRLYGYQDDTDFKLMDFGKKR
ncbi:hypothetical protein CLU95_5425 [Variovorax sp. 54]|uniref:hypothetical protein n=1 Tax=Variovorax sp. 54 TaxID=2035212 RepID=UPI000C36D3ED|nr:hypothetical protein [Variovorax sp. 54]PIF78242.1 hypothetical protein CLU95_5425 [Variovorax sp. 54]